MRALDIPVEGVYSVGFWGFRLRFGVQGCGVRGFGFSRGFWGSGFRGLVGQVRGCTALGASGLGGLGNGLGLAFRVCSSGADTILASPET